jgi:hypothetical protein
MTDFRSLPQDDASDPVPALGSVPGWASVDSTSATAPNGTGAS